MSGGKFEMGDYNDVASRLVEFRAKYPTGSLQPADPSTPYRVEQIGQDAVIVVVTAAYRTPDDPRPGIGMASEPYPGKTPYTRGSEWQNAETSSWGRALIAVGAADARRGVASAEEVRNRRAERAAVPPGERMAKAREAVANATGLDQIERIERHIASLVDGGELSEEDAAELRQTLDGPRNNRQNVAIMTLLGRIGLPYSDANKPEVLRLFSAWVDREIGSTKELSMREAGTVLGCLADRAALPPAGADEVPSS